MKIPLMLLCLFLTTTIAAKGPLSESRLSTYPYHTGTGTGTGTGYPHPTITGVQPTHTPCSPYNTTGTSKAAPVRRAGAYPYKRDADWSSHGWCAPPPATGSGVVKSHGSPSHSRTSLLHRLSFCKAELLTGGRCVVPFGVTSTSRYQETSEWSEADSDGEKWDSLCSGFWTDGGLWYWVW